jgi:hypothetical protein
LREQPLPTEDEPLFPASYSHWTHPGHVEAQLPSGAASFSAPRRRQSRVSCVGLVGLEEGKKRELPESLVSVLAGKKRVARIFGSACVSTWLSVQVFLLNSKTP